MEPVQGIGVVGAFRMGSGVAQVLAMVGFSVQIRDLSATMAGTKAKAELPMRPDHRCRHDANFPLTNPPVSLTGLAAASAQPGRVIGPHFLNPVAGMQLVEITPALQDAGTAAPGDTVAPDVVPNVTDTALHDLDDPEYRRSTLFRQRRARVIRAASPARSLLDISGMRTG